eukprot:5213377-Amphidinium_carterae.1
MEVHATLTSRLADSSLLSTKNCGVVRPMLCAFLSSRSAVLYLALSHNSCAALFAAPPLHVEMEGLCRNKQQMKQCVLQCVTPTSTIAYIAHLFF